MKKTATRMTIFVQDCFMENRIAYSHTHTDTKNYHTFISILTDCDLATFMKF